jgi:hypothetical protein
VTATLDFAFHDYATWLQSAASAASVLAPATSMAFYRTINDALQIWLTSKRPSLGPPARRGVGAGYFFGGFQTFHANLNI